MEQIHSVSNKTIVITGATSGIGLAAASELARQGADVIGVGRSAQNCASAEAGIRRENPGAHIRFLQADLSSQRQVRQLAAGLRPLLPDGLDVLVNNAGTVSNWYTATEDGYELQFAVNHLAGFLLAHELLPELHKSSGGRVLTTSSGSHRSTRMHWRDVMYRRGYHILLAYKQSKLANVLFSAEFNRRYGKDTSLRAYAVDPGLVNTPIGLKGTSGLARLVWKWRSSGGAAPEIGAATIVHLATAELSDSDREAVYWKNCRPLAASRAARDEEEAARLWELSLRLCGLEAARVEDFYAAGQQLASALAGD